MVKCEICGKEMRTTQGRRGHMTFVHGQGKAVRSPIAVVAPEVDDDQDRHHGDTVGRSYGEALADISRRLEELEAMAGARTDQLSELATRGDLGRVDAKVDKVASRVSLHDKWFNPGTIHEAIVRLKGGPIAQLERRLSRRSEVPPTAKATFRIAAPFRVSEPYR
jgi:hypothetical protein